MTESYIQYANGYQKESMTELDINRAFKDIQELDDVHDAF